MKRGEITIFISLLLAIIMVLSVVLVEGIRIRHDRLVAASCMELGVDSVCSEYDRDLLEQYDLFFIPASYGAESFDKTGLDTRMLSYMGQNLYPDLETGALSDTLSIQELHAETLSFATDNYGLLFKQQAVSYMENKLGLDVLYDVLDEFELGEKGNEGTENFLKKDQRITEQMPALLEEKEKADAEKPEEAKAAKTQTNPADSVNALKNTGILTLVTEGTDALSSKMVSLSDLPSGRTLNQGNASLKASFSVVQEAFFHEYILEKFPCYTDKQKGALEYQLEYILIGKDSDKENLEGTVKRLLLLREGINFAYLLTDAGKLAQAETAAVLLTGYTGIPLLIEAVKYAILLAWAYAESLVDVRSLLSGKKISLIKTAKNWKLGFENMADAGVCRSSDNEEGGLSYKEYLRILLYLEKNEKKTMRCMDMIESNLKAQGKVCRMDWYVGYIIYHAEFVTTPLFLQLPFRSSKTQFQNMTFTLKTKGSYQ